jgi:RHS repeat-associated protein
VCITFTPITWERRNQLHSRAATPLCGDGIRIRFGTAVPNQNPSNLGTLVYILRFPVQYYDQETGLNYNYYRDLDTSTGRYVESDPSGLKGGLNTYDYARASPVMWIDPSRLVACPGGEWSQDFAGPAGINLSFGGYFSKGRFNFTCRSNPSVKCSASVLCIGGGAILGAGMGWSIYGYVVGAPNSSDLTGWSGWQVTGSIGPLGLQAPPGGGVSVTGGPSVGAGIAGVKCYTYAMICTPSGCGRSN